MPLTGEEWHQSCYTELAAPTAGEPLLIAPATVNTAVDTLIASLDEPVDLLGFGEQYKLCVGRK